MISFKQFVEETKNKVEDFYRKNNIDKDKLIYLGKGDFGTAYQIDDDRVLKITTSKSEFDYAKDLIGKDKQFSSLSKIYDAEKINGNYYIISEYLNEDSSIEEKYNEVRNMLDEVGYSMFELPSLDFDDLSEQPDKETEKFIDELIDVRNDMYRLTGKMSIDLQSENLSYDKKGKLKAFDIDTRGSM